MKKEGVYGRNDPKEEDTGVPTARDEDPDNVHPDHERGVGEMLEENREQNARKEGGGGMGRKEVPKERPHAEPGREDIHEVAETEADSDQMPS